ncbi:FKBP-type peptidyl-prolyl cis-trans isomerase [Marinobacterium arenosum]|uniref:FKBP-type peptidyl-prolyl cis-trans isomerase n=1 Tax=Marinobacterium arenosum TaxID=2862496 RepID=UPI001C97B1DC|nr:FKBP-type peptidyl-prolyl cis-trans isomerase [Marinobacterium arenosum]MBY4675513.1 FKBP-type peptidyl-prolyl cis-trans isomerase [Marinobacterium arenosum]
MKRTWLAAAMATALTAAPTLFAAELENEQQKLSYSLGLILGQQLKQQVEKLDFEAFRSGVETIYSGSEPKLTDEQVNEVMQAFQARKMEEQRQRFAELAAANMEKGKSFMAENAKKGSVQTTDSGLQYEELTAGTGKSPTAEDTVQVHYEGTLVDGTKFDSSYDRGEPVSFPLNGVIPGWTEGLQLMKEGGKTRFVIPADLAYGPGGMGNAIGPNETLVFEVELLKVNPEDKK